MADTTKRCDYCRSQIDKEAVRCPHCTMPLAWAGQVRIPIRDCGTLENIWKGAMMALGAFLTFMALRTLADWAAAEELARVLGR